MARNYRQSKTYVDTEVLRLLMGDLGFSQPELAIFCGFDRSFVSQVLRRGFCNYYSLDKIACAPGIHVSTLVSDTKREGERHGATIQARA